VAGDAPVQEDVRTAPGEQCARLELPRAGELPAAGERCRHAAVGQEGVAFAERQLVAGGAGQTPRARVVATLPERRLAVVLFDGPVVTNRVGIEREEAGEALAQAAIDLHFERMCLRLAERQIRVRQVRERAEGPEQAL